MWLVFENGELMKTVDDVEPDWFKKCDQPESCSHFKHNTTQQQQKQQQKHNTSAMSSDSNNSNSNSNKGVMHDKAVPGGESRRQVDVYLSEKLGGYRSEQVQQGGEPSFYGKYVEPILHATEHVARSVTYDNPNEMARAKDELKCVGTGLHKMETKYQDQQKSQDHDNKLPESED